MRIFGHNMNINPKCIHVFMQDHDDGVKPIINFFNIFY